MATFNYARVAVRAISLVERFGKAVTLRRLNAIPPDPAKLWIPADDPREPAEFVPGGAEGNFTELAVTAVFAEPSSLKDLGGPNAQLVDWVRRAQQIAIIAHPDDLSTFSELVDTDGSLWRVVGASTLNPGGTRLLHYVGVSR
jgi:hypothetical protein